MEIEQRKIKIRRIPGANMKISFKSKKYPGTFVISTAQLDYNFFDMSSWFLKRVIEHDNCFLFCSRWNYREFGNFFKNNTVIRECLDSFAQITSRATELGGTISMYYKTGKVGLILPNNEWWTYHLLLDDLEELKKWCDHYY